MSVDELAPTFTLADARAVGLSKDKIYSMLQAGAIERMGRGIYIRPTVIDPAFAPLAAATAAREEATLCLTSALVHHDLSDAIPLASDIALPRGVRHPAGVPNVIWHSFDETTFSVGRESIEVEGISLAIYSAERSIVDSFRLMHQEGSDVAYEALRRFLRQDGSSPGSLIRIAKLFPKALPKIRRALEVLL